MKVCFILQRRFAYIGNYLALWLQQKYGVGEFSGYVYQRWSYDELRRQSAVKYTALLLDEDIHKRYEQEKLDLAYLASLERDLGIPNLWPYLALDRIIMSNQLVREYPYDNPPYSHEEMMRILQVKAKAVSEFLDREKPDCVVYSVIGAVGARLLYEMAKKRGIKTLGVLMACTEGRYVFTEKFDYFTDVEKIFARNKINPVPAPYLEQAKTFLQNFRAKPQPYHESINAAFAGITRYRQLKFLLPQNWFRSLAWFAQVVVHYLKQRKRQDFSDTMHPWYYMVDHVKRKLRTLIGYRDLYDPIDPAEDFAFFPLHLEPEIATLLQAPLFTDQLNLVRHIARALPIHFKLYVKEHPQMVNYRTRAFYKELKKIPNVKLIDPRVPGSSIVPLAKLITVITSTVGWEGVILKKPVIAFGDQFYVALSMVKKCTALERLPFLVKERLENYRFDEQELIAYLAAIFEDSVDIDLTQLWELETDETKKKAGLEPLADLLAKKLGLVNFIHTPV